MSLNVVNGYLVGFENGIYIGRGGKGKRGSPLANPFQIGKDGDRNEVIQKYRKWLYEQITANNKAVMSELQMIYDLSRYFDIDLVCFCAPNPCHGDVIVRCLKWLNEQKIEGFC